MSKEKEISPFFDQFLIVGAPFTEYEGITPLPEILNIFPSNPLVVEENLMYKLIDFCFPCGMKHLTANERESSNILDTFAFRLGGGTIKYFGACVKIQVSNLEQCPFFATKSSSRFPFVLCIITATPVLTSHFQFLFFLIENLCNIDNIKINISDIDEIPIPKGESLSIMDVRNGIGTCPRIKPNKNFYRIVNKYRSLHQDVYSVKKYKLDDTHDLMIPRISTNSNYLALCCLDTLFSLLSVSDIISVYASALVGNYVIFRSKNLHNITFATLGLISLMTPFPPKLPMMPILPNTEMYLELLNSPIPFIFGISTSIDITNYDIDPYSTIVDLDEKTITNPKEVSVPYKEDEVRFINDILEQERKNIAVPEKMINDYSQFVNPEYSVFFGHIRNSFTPKNYISDYEPQYVFNQKTVERILRVFSDRIGPCLALVKKEVQELRRM